MQLASGRTQSADSMLANSLAAYHHNFCKIRTRLADSLHLYYRQRLKVSISLYQERLAAESGRTISDDRMAAKSGIKAAQCDYLGLAPCVSGVRTAEILWQTHTRAG